MSDENVSLSLISGKNDITISWNGIFPPTPSRTLANSYWMIVLSRKDLSVVANAETQDQSTTPSAVLKYDSNPDYILLLSATGIISSRYPKGEFAEFIFRNGMCPNLSRGIQVSCILNDEFNFFNYCMAGVMGTETGFDSYEMDGRAFLTLRLINKGDGYFIANTFPG